jgi:hypothetical protein
MSGRVVKGQAQQVSASGAPYWPVRKTSVSSSGSASESVISSGRRLSEPVFGAALIDQRGNLLGAGIASNLAGEVEVPPGIDLRREDLSSYLDGGLGSAGGRRFPLVSATWVQVRSKRVRVGIYMESGDWLVNPERVELDLGRVAAILSTQGVA